MKNLIGATVKSVRNGKERFGKVISDNQTTIALEIDGVEKPVSVTTFKRWWNVMEEAEPVMEESEPIMEETKPVIEIVPTPEPAQEAKTDVVGNKEISVDSIEIIASQNNCDVKFTNCGRAYSDFVFKLNKKVILKGYVSGKGKVNIYADEEICKMVKTEFVITNKNLCRYNIDKDFTLLDKIIKVKMAAVA